MRSIEKCIAAKSSTTCTRKRDRWGQTHQAARPEAEWLRRGDPALQIVSDESWQAAHARLAASRQTYFRMNKGQLWGRPVAGTASKYLLVGLTRCGCCGGGMVVKSRDHGRKRAHRYACSSYHLRGRSVCENKFELILAEADALMLDAVEQDLLADDVVEMAIAEAVAMLSAPVAPVSAIDDARRELRAIQGQLLHLTSAVASGGELSSLVDAIRQREQRRVQLERQVAAATWYALWIRSGSSRIYGLD